MMLKILQKTILPLMLLGLIFSCGWLEASNSSDDKLIVYYFHGNKRCATCRNLENYAKEALEIGMVNKICEPDALIDECKKMANMICETGPIALEQAKFAINYGIETDINTGLAIESHAYWVTIPTKDRLEGLAAFREKRKPVYKGI